MAKHNIHHILIYNAYFFNFNLKRRVTVEPRYNEVPRDRTIYFVITGIRLRNPDITKLQKNHEKLRYTGVLLHTKISDDMYLFIHSCSVSTKYNVHELETLKSQKHEYQNCNTITEQLSKGRTLYHILYEVLFLNLPKVTMH